MWALVGPADAFELPYRSDLTGPAHPVAGPPAFRVARVVRRWAEGPPADLTRRVTGPRPGREDKGGMLEYAGGSVVGTVACASHPSMEPKRIRGRARRGRLVRHSCGLHATGVHRSCGPGQ